MLGSFLDSGISIERLLQMDDPPQEIFVGGQVRHSEVLTNIQLPRYYEYDIMTLPGDIVIVESM